MAFHANVERLQTDFKQLKQQWEQVRSRWKDKAREHFERVYWTPLERQTSITFKEMNNLAETIAKAQKHVK